MRVFPLPEGSIHAETEEQCTLLEKVRKMGLNLATIQLEMLHELLHGIAGELRLREQRAISAISEIKVNNWQLFTEKAQILEEKEVL